MTDLALLKKEAKSKKTSLSRLEELARHADSSVHSAVAGNPSAPTATLEYLWQSTQLNLLKALAKNPNTPPHLIERLARHRHDTVRQAVARWAQIPETVALELLNDPAEHTRFLLVEHSSRFRWDRVRLFKRAARDSSSLVRITVAYWAKASDTLEGLLNDVDWKVVAHALGNSNLALAELTAKLQTTFERFNLEGNWRDALRIVKRRDLLAQWLERFAAHPNATVRVFVARNPNMPRSALLMLARDSDWDVLSQVATLPDLPGEVYLSYAQHD